jgi:DNA-binding transcriptional LysR family regulator
MELRHLRYFVAVAEELHFGRAARRLGISQPPLSQQIRVLEKDLGVPLFDRTRQGVQLTPTGQAMLADAYRLLEQAERVRSIAARTEQAAAATLHVGCLSSVFFGLLPPLVARLRARHPEIDLALVDVETTTGIEALSRGTLDVAIVRPERVAAPLRSQAILRDRMMLAIPEGHPLAKRKRVALKSLEGEPLVAFARRNLPRRYDEIIAQCLKAGFSPNLAYHSTSIPSQIGCVACSLGIALVPTSVRDWKVPGVVYRDLDPPIALPDLQIVWNASKPSDAVLRFVEAGRQAFAAKGDAIRA